MYMLIVFVDIHHIGKDISATGANRNNATMLYYYIYALVMLTKLDILTWKH